MKPKANRATGSLDMRQDLVDGVVRLQLKDLLTKANESDDSTLLVKLSQCLNPSTSQLAEYMKILSQISTSLKKYCDCTDVTCEGSITVYISVLAEIHSAVTRNPVRRMISSTLQNLPQRCHSVVIQQFSSCLQRYMSKTSGDDPDHRRHVIDLIASYLENWPLGECVLAAINKPVLAYLSVSVATLVRACCEAESPTALTNLTQSCHVILKNTIAVLQKCFHGNRSAGTDSLHHDAVVGLINAVFEILSNSIFTTNCQSVAGMTLIAALKLMSDSENMVSMIMKTLLPHCCPGHLPSVNKPIQDVNEELSNFRIHWNQLSTYCQLCVCHGILAMLDIDNLVSEVRPHTTLLDLMFTEVMKLQKSLVDSYSILAASRTLTLWTHTAKQALQLSMQNNLRSSLSGQGSVSKHILDYVWENWEHAIEGMRYQIKIIFENVIEMHILATGKEHRISNDSFILDLFHQLMTNSWHIRSKYSFLVTMVTYIGSARVLELHPTMPQDVLSAMEEQTTAPYASDLYEKLLQSHKEQMKQMTSESSCHGDDTWQQVWLPPVLEVLNSRKLGSTLLVQYLLPRLLKNNPESLDYIIGSLHTSSNESHLSAMITCLKVARSQGLLAQRPCDNSETWHGVIHVSLLKQAVCHKDNQISIQALSLICDSSKSTEVFSSVDFQLIKLFLKCNTKNQSAASRHCINSNVKKILSRIQEGGLVLWKQRHKEEAKVQLTLYKEFVEWLYNFTFSNLYCDACYPRRATALSILTLLQDAFTTKAKKEGVEFSFWSQWTSVHVQSILECLTDSYVGNREMAHKLLVNVPTIPDKMSYLYKIGLDLANGSRPQDSVIAANILSVACHCGAVTAKDAFTDLLNSLKEHIKEAKISLLQAAASSPMYGLLYCIRVLLKDKIANQPASASFMKNSTEELIQLCLDAASVVSPVVCNTSPEGYLPVDDDKAASVSLECLVFKNSADDASDVNDGSYSVTVTPQMVLVCCWVTMKEVSLLLGQLTQMSKGQSSQLLDSPQMTKIGRFFMDLLMQARHRGAFELSYNGFEQLCNKLWRNSDKVLNSLPRQWLQVLLSEISSDSENSQLCATRRSAGIPFAFQAILNGEPPLQSERQHFKAVMEKLLTLAKGDGVTGPTFTPQVHALNVLCALYRDSKLGEDVFPFIADGVKVAILGFDSQKWSVRNSCMMLLNALVTRIFGVKRSKDEHSKKNQMSGREFFSRFPSLHGFLLDHLKIVIKQINNLQPSQFAILLILSRLYSSTFDGVDSNQSSADFIPYIRECCKSNVWKTRTIAARALASLTPTNKLVSMVTELINSLPTSPSLITISQNTIHGILLQLHHLLQHCHSDHRLPVNVQEELVAMAIPMLKTSLWLGTRCNKCDITRAAYLQVIDSHVLTLTDISQSGKLNEFKDIVRSHLRVEISHDASPVECSPGSVLVEEKMAAISWKINAYENNTDLQWLIDILNSPFYEVRLYSMKELVEVFKSTSPCRDDGNIRKIWDDNTLFAELVKVMLQEINTDCIAKVYQALYHHDLTLMFPWRQADCDPWTCLQVFVFLQKRLCSSLDTARCDLSSSLMQLMSKLVPDIYSQAAQSSCAEEHRRVLQDWMDTIPQTTSVEQPMELKLMTAHSIVQVSSYLLHDPEDLLGAVPLSLWKSVITLLQDEEEEIRQAITPAVTSSKSECNPLDMHSNTALNNVFATIIHLHGNKHWDAVCQFLLTTITKEESDEDEVHDEDPQGDRLYDKGEANSFAETTELVQLAAEALKPLLASSSPLQQTQLHMIQDRRRDLLTKLKEFTSRLDLENHCPFRSTSTHRYNCVFLYRTLTCLLALSTVPLSDQNHNILEDVGKTLQILKDTGCGLNVYLNDLVNDFTDKYMISAVT